MRRKEKMMKKLLIFMLVLGLASVSQAALVGLEIGGAKEYTATAGEVITINLVADTPYSSSLLMVVEGDASVATAVVDMDGTSTLPVGGTGVVITEGYLDNYDGVLFDYVSAGASPVIAAGSVIMSFEYTVSSGWAGTDFWLAPLATGTSYEWASGSFDTAALSQATLIPTGEDPIYNVPITGVHIIPEPMTVLLLGLGGLLLRRRKGRS